MEEQNNPQQQQNADVVSKSEYEAKAAEVDKLKAELEDLRLEVLSPEYMEFLNSKDSPQTQSQASDATLTLPSSMGDDAFEKMSKKELFERAKEAAKADLKAEIEKVKESYVSESREATKKEITAFARKHEDFETFRPIMYGLSLDPKNADLTLQELYDLAKEHVKRIHTEPSEEEKKRQAKLSGEKPGGASESYEELRKLSTEEATKAALEETKQKLGITKFPSA